MPKQTSVLFLIPIIVIPLFTPFLPTLLPTLRIMDSDALSTSACSCTSCHVSSGGVTADRVVEHEWLEGERKSRVVEEALSMVEYKKLETLLREKGYTPERKGAIAVRFVKSEEAKVEYILVGIPFKGEESKPTFVIVALKPSREALAFQLADGNRTLKLIAREPKDQPSRLLPTKASEGPYTSPAGMSAIHPNPQYQQCQLPNCPPCQAPACQCVSWNVIGLIYCLATSAGGCLLSCAPYGSNPSAFLTCLISCSLMNAPWCLLQACTGWVGVCVDCLSNNCVYSICCQNCPSCFSHPRCLGYARIPP